MAFSIPLRILLKSPPQSLTHHLRKHLALPTVCVSKFPSFFSQQGPPLVAIVGLPNAGKSSLFNRLIGESKSLITPMAGTTRDRYVFKLSFLSDLVASTESWNGKIGNFIL